MWPHRRSGSSATNKRARPRGTADEPGRGAEPSRTPRGSGGTARDRRSSGNMLKPNRAARWAAGGPPPPIMITGWGCCTGLGVTCTVWPRYSNGSPVQACTSTSRASSSSLPRRLQSLPNSVVLDRPVAEAGHDRQPPAADEVEHGDVLGQADRVVQRQQEGGDPERDAAGAGSHGPRQDERRRQVPVGGAVVLGEHEHVEAAGVGPLAHLDGRGVEPLGLLRLEAGGPHVEADDRESHRTRSSSCATRRATTSTPIGVGAPGDGFPRLRRQTGENLGLHHVGRASVAAHPLDPGGSHARSRHRLHRPHAHRPGHQGLARRPAAPTTSAATIVNAALEQGARRSTATGRGPDPRLRPARRRGRLQHRPASPPSWPACPTSRRHRQPLLLVVAADDPHGRPRHQGRRGRRLHRRRRRDREPLHERRGRHRPAQPAVRRRRGPHRRAHRRRPGRRGPRPRACPTSTSPWARPPRTWPSSRTSPARRWTSSPPSRQQRATAVARARLLRAGDHAGHARPTAPSSAKDDGIRARHHRREPRRPQAGVPPRRQGHRRQRLPAQRRRRRRRRDERHPGRRARPHPAGPHRRQRRHRPQPRDHGPRPDRGLPPGPGPGRHDHRRHRPRRDQRGVRRPGHPVGQAPRHLAGTSSTSTAAPSPSATRSA